MYRCRSYLNQDLLGYQVHQAQWAPKEFKDTRVLMVQEVQKVKAVIKAKKVLLGHMVSQAYEEKKEKKVKEERREKEDCQAEKVQKVKKENRVPLDWISHVQWDQMDYRYRGAGTRRKLDTAAGSTLEQSCIQNTPVTCTGDNTMV
ncbi:hypothetical protein JD844_012199, partial [Phrynosoma platyrhinos]